MTIFDQFWREKFKYFEFLSLEMVNFDTKFNIDHFSSFSRICILWTKNGPLTHCATPRTLKKGGKMTHKWTTSSEADE